MLKEGVEECRAVGGLRCWKLLEPFTSGPCAPWLSWSDGTGGKALDGGVEVTADMALKMAIPPSLDVWRQPYVRLKS
jgi:hypothetical protein